MTVAIARRAIMGNKMEIATKIAEENWTWFQDYAFFQAEWTVNSPDRTCQVGMGMMLFGEPRGEKVRFSGFKEFTTVGMGAIHVRAVDGRGRCKVRLDQGKVGLIPIISDTF